MKPAGPISRRLTSIMKKEDNSRHKDTSLTSVVSIRLAVNEEDFAAAYHLIYKQYIKYGYMDAHPAEMRISYWNLLPTTYTVIAEQAGNVIGTVSYIIDSGASLPMDEVASDALDSLRVSGRNLCEIPGLAIDDARANNETVLMMFRYGFQLSYNQLAVDSFVITVNPRHEKFYKRMLSFKQIAETCAYQKVKQAPGVPLFLDLITAEQAYFERHGHRRSNRNLHRFFFSDGIDKLKREIARDVQLRNRRVTLSFVHQMARNAPDLLIDTKQRDLLDRVWMREELTASA